MYGKIRSIEEIIDWCLKALDVKSDRKSIERYKKNINQKITGDTLVYNDFIEDILESLDIENDAREDFRDILENFIEIYKQFATYVESYYTSQKQLDFLVAKDMLIPFFALLSSLIFNRSLIILKQIKPDKNKKSFQKFLDLSEKNICQKDIKNYLLSKYEQDESYTKSYDSISKTINAWLASDKHAIPKKEHFERIIQYLQECGRIPHTTLHNLALFAKLFEKIHEKLEATFNNKEIELLIEHYYFLLEFYLKLQSSFSIEETENRIYSELLRHINPQIINRNFYFDDYFAWIQKLINRDYLTPHKLIRNLLDKRNMLYYLLPEKECMKYIDICLPIQYFNRIKPQNEYLKLKQDLGSQISEFEKGIQKEYVNLQSKLFFIHLDINKEKTLDDKIKCNEIFQNLENKQIQDNSTPYALFLKTRYFIFDNNPKEALTHCRKCVELGVGKLGEHFKEAVMTGLLLSAKNDSKKEYNFFRKTAIKYDALFFGQLKVPAYSRSGTLIDIPDNKEIFKELQNEYDKYFSNKFK